MSAVVHLGGIDFGAGPDADGDRFVLGEIDGWDAPDVELVLADRPLSPGGVVARARYTAQAVTLIGHGIAPTPEGVWRVRGKIAAAADLVAASGTLTVDEPGGDKALTVWLAAAPRIRRAGPYAVEFEIDLIAPDPEKFTP